MKNLKLIIMLLLSIAFTNCDQVKLSENDAQKLIEQSLSLPKKMSIPIWFADETVLNMLLNDGLITAYHIDPYIDRDHFIEVSEAYKQYNLGETHYMARRDYIFKIYDIEFAKIDGISINKENKTALVRFTLKFTNISPFARSLVKIQTGWNHPNINRNLDNTISVELNLRNFDSGWQIESNGQVKEMNEKLY